MKIPERCETHPLSRDDVVRFISGFASDLPTPPLADCLLLLVYPPRHESEAEEREWFASCADCAAAAEVANEGVVAVIPLPDREGGAE